MLGKGTISKEFNKRLGLDHPDSLDLKMRKVTMIVILPLMIGFFIVVALIVLFNYQG